MDLGVRREEGRRNLLVGSWNGDVVRKRTTEGKC